MRRLLIIILLSLTGCSLSEVSMQMSDYPEWNWMDQQLYMQNVRISERCFHLPLFDLVPRNACISAIAWISMIPKGSQPPAALDKEFWPDAPLSNSFPH